MMSISYWQRSLLQREEIQDILKPMKTKPNIDRFMGLKKQLVQGALQQKEKHQIAKSMQVAYIKKKLQIQNEMMLYDITSSTNISQRVKICCLVDYSREKTNRFAYQNKQKAQMIIFKMIQTSMKQLFRSRFISKLLFSIKKVIKITDLAKAKKIFIVNLLTNFQINFSSKKIFSILYIFSVCSIQQNRIKRRISKEKAVRNKSNSRQAPILLSIMLYLQQAKFQINEIRVCKPKKEAIAIKATYKLVKQQNIITEQQTKHSNNPINRCNLLFWHICVSTFLYLFRAYPSTKKELKQEPEQNSYPQGGIFQSLLFTIIFYVFF
ncbi:hypothetical protein ABPG72_008239 [Tetrahymena utriculariae]